MRSKDPQIMQKIIEFVEKYQKQNDTVSCLFFHYVLSPRQFRFVDLIIAYYYPHLNTFLYFHPIEIFQTMNCLSEKN